LTGKAAFLPQWIPDIVKAQNPEHPSCENPSENSRSGSCQLDDLKKFTGVL
jgi:hypothetical protein